LWLLLLYLKNMHVPPATTSACAIACIHGGSCSLEYIG
jgi:hypothetical protein